MPCLVIENAGIQLVSMFLKPGYIKKVRVSQKVDKVDMVYKLIF